MLISVVLIKFKHMENVKLLLICYANTLLQFFFCQILHFPACNSAETPCLSLKPLFL